MAKKRTTKKAAKRRPRKRKATGSRKSTSKAKPVVKESMIPQEGVYLNVPWDERPIASNRGAKYYGGDVRSWIFEAGKDKLPTILKHYLPVPFSWLGWKQYRLNGELSYVTSEPNAKIKLRPHQTKTREMIKEAKESGAPGFVLNHETGLGKTYTSIASVKEMGDEPLNVLVIAPIAVHEQWRRALRDMGTGNKRFCVINYESLKTLLTVPPEAVKAKRTRTKNKAIASKGTPVETWDVVICDESQKLKNPSALQTQAYFTLRRGAFQIWSSATPGQIPSEFVYMSDIFEYRATGMCGWNEKSFHKWATQLGFHVEKSDYGSLDVTWDIDHEEDIDLLNKVLFRDKPVVGDALESTSIPNWPELQRIPFPIKLDNHEQDSYESLWTEFRNEHDLAKKGKNPTNGLAAQLRFRQKTSILRVPYVADLVANLVEQGYQVPVSIEFKESVEKLGELLDKKNISYTTINGDHNGTEKEERRLMFQRDEVQVVLYSVREGISLHANEEAVNGSATARVGIIADPRWSGIDTKQIEGRQHRNGENAPIYHVFISDTIDEKVVLATVKRLDKLNKISGNDESSIQEVFEALIS